MKVVAAAAAKLLQSCPTLCDPIDGSPPGSPIPGILQARTLEWVAISFSNAWKWKGKVKSLSHVQLLATPWTAAYQAPPSMGFSRQEYWSGVPLPSPWKWLREPIGYSEMMPDPKSESPVSQSEKLGQMMHSSLRSALRHFTTSRFSCLCCDSWGLRESDTTEWLNWTGSNLRLPWSHFDNSLTITSSAQANKLCPRKQY